MENLEKNLKNFWTDKKRGKHKDLISKHEYVLKKNLLVDSDELFKQISKNKFLLTNFESIKIDTLLRKSKLDSFLKSNYIKDCMSITTPRPAIGKGEFLMVSIFGNLYFSKKSGDLVNEQNKVMEIKGIRGRLGGDVGFKQMNKDIMFSVYRLFNTNPDHKDLSKECIEDLSERLKDNKKLAPRFFYLIQNIENNSKSLAKKMSDLYTKTNNLLYTIAAGHLYSYTILQKIDYFLVFNDRELMGFNAPKNIEEAYKALGNFNIGGWTTGSKGVSITLKK